MEKTMKKFGFGAMRLPLLNPDDKKSIDQKELNRMVDLYMQRGFTYFDTAYPYHEQMSEPAMKKALVDRYDRSSYIFADKMPTVLVKGPEEYPMYFQSQLERTGVGYFDYYLMHNMGKDRYDKTSRFGGFDFARRMKDAGKIKHFGFSFHDDADTLDRILTENPEVDFVQLQLNYLDWNNSIIQSHKCYETAVKHHKPIIVMEPVKGGVLANLPEEAHALIQAYDPTITPASLALRFAASKEHVMMVLSGMSNLTQVEENTSSMQDFTPLSDKEYALLDQITEIINRKTAIACTSCEYCMEVCPKQIYIPALFGLYNNYTATGNFSSMYYNRNTYNRGKASDCIHCHRCESNCPQHIKIPDFLEKIAAFEK
jgi:predicted aldo/keto reductase-like oxidoreductase